MHLMQLKSKHPLLRMKFSRLLLLSFVLVSCSRDIPSPLPQGVQTISGLLLPAELSMVRRGTHVLTKNGEELYFVESSLITLRAYERKIVTLRGTLERNVEDKLLPVLIVESVVDSESTVHEQSIRHLRLTLSVPKDWKHSQEGSTSFFFVPESEDPVLVLSQQDAPEEFPFGVSIVVDGSPAVRIINEQTGTQAVYVRHGERMLTMLFTAGRSEHAETLREKWLSVLASVELHEKNLPSNGTPSGTGAAAGMPCGGPAGVLCPAGEYCEVTDTEQDIGTCRGL
jgi:hypothetical protein